MLSYSHYELKVVIDVECLGDYMIRRNYDTFSTNSFMIDLDTVSKLLLLLALVVATVSSFGACDMVTRLRIHGPEELVDLMEVVPLAEVPRVRQMALNADGSLLVMATMNFSDISHIYAVGLDRQDDTGKLTSRKRYTIAENLFMPSGIAFDKDTGSIYVAEINQIIRIDKIEERIQNGQVPVPESELVQVAKLPEDIVHGWKYLTIVREPGTNAKYLIFPVGVPCNICDDSDPYGTINALPLADSDGENNNRPWIVVARGVRNSVGLVENPKNPGELFFTDNGRDHLGDDQPCDELNRIPDLWSIIHATSEPLNFGFPFCHGQDTEDPEFPLPNGMQCSKYDFHAPSWCLGPHVAALGLDVVDMSVNNMIPKGLFGNTSNAIIIAEHGSWNRNPPLGYRISLVDLDDPSEESYRVVLDGFKDPDNNERADDGRAIAIFGRPVDALVYPHDGGSLLFSDDFGHTIYHMRRKNGINPDGGQNSPGNGHHDPDDGSDGNGGRASGSDYSRNAMLSVTTMTMMAVVWLL